LPLALAAAPPVEHGDFRAPDLVELTRIEPGIRLDIRYASTRNFLGTPLYGQARAFLQRPAALALARVHRALAADGYGVLVHDAYRPWYVTKIFWDAVPLEQIEPWIRERVPAGMQDVVARGMEGARFRAAQKTALAGAAGDYLRTRDRAPAH